MKAKRPLALDPATTKLSAQQALLATGHRAKHCGPENPVQPIRFSGHHLFSGAVGFARAASCSQPFSKFYSKVLQLNLPFVKFPFVFSSLVIALLAAWCGPAGAEDQLLMALRKPANDARTVQPTEPIPLPPMPGGNEEALPYSKVPVSSPIAKEESIPSVTKPTGGDELTLAEAESMATSFHPALRTAGAEVRAAHGNWVQVGLRPNPVLGYAGTEIGDDGRAGQQGGFFSQEFVTGGKLELNRAVAAREQAAAEQRVEFTRWQVVTTVRKNYFEAVAAERSVMLAHQLNEIAAQSKNVSAQRLKAMDVPKTSLLQSEVESESAALLEQQATERAAAARRRLATTIGIQDESLLNLEDVFARPLPELDFNTVSEQIMRNSPELGELLFEADRARWAVQRANAGRKQNVNLQTGVQYDNATQYAYANVQLSMPIPVFDRNQGAIAEACGDLAAAQAALEAGQLAIRQRLTIAMRDYTTARQRVAKYKETILPAAKETLDLVNTGYQQGELDYVQVLSVQQTYAAKNLAYLRDLETAWQQWAEIDGYLVGEVSASPNDAIRPQVPDGQ